MKLEIIWSDFAEKQLDEIFDYYNEKASTKVAKRLIKNLLNEPKNIDRKSIYRTNGGFTPR